MTVGELIEKLSEYDRWLPVAMNGSTNATPLNSREPQEARLELDSKRNLVIIR